MATKKWSEVRRQPTQTTPQGAEIPVPKRGDFMRDLTKTAKRKPTAQPETKSGD